MDKSRLDPFEYYAEEDIAECLYCNAWVPNLDPKTFDGEETWMYQSRFHASDCEWIRTRAHTMYEEE